MKILHITTIDTGGAFKAVERLNQCLIQSGYDSEIILRTRNCKDVNAYEYLDTAAKRIVSKSKNFFNLALKKGEIERDLLGSDLSKLGKVKNADIICIHWVNSFLSYKGFEQILKLNKKTIFFMHDMWLFTGGCHVDRGCGKYEQSCGRCPLIDSKKDKDITYRNFVDKAKLFKRYDFTVCGPSKWIVECAKKSDALSNKRIECLPNCYDDGVFFCRDKDEARKTLGFNTDKTVILFGAAHDGTANKNKGFDYLQDALTYLDKNKYFLLIFGNADESLFESIGFEHKLLGYVNGDRELADVYSAADIYVTPSLQESFGYTVCEAMACGTPVVAFPVGGILDQIKHKENGYLASLKDSRDLANGIDYVYKNREELGRKAAMAAIQFSYGVLMEKYKSFFDLQVQE